MYGETDRVRATFNVVANDEAALTRQIEDANAQATNLEAENGTIHNMLSHYSASVLETSPLRRTR